MMVSDGSGVDGELGKMATVRACVFTTDGKGQKSWPAGGTPSDLHGAHDASSAATRWKGVARRRRGFEAAGLHLDERRETRGGVDRWCFRS
jgi:hypothetical protein